MKLKIVSRYPRYKIIPENTVSYENGGGYSSVEELRHAIYRRFPETNKIGTRYVCDIKNGCRTHDGITGMEQDLTLEGVPPHHGDERLSKGFHEEGMR